MDKCEYTEQELINDPSFVEWAMGNSEGDQSAYWNEWIKQSDEHRRKALEAQKKITGLRFISPQLPDIKNEWSKVRDDIEKKKNMKLHTPKKHAAGKDGGLMGYLFKAVAVVLIGAFVGLFIYMYQEPKPENEPVSTMTVKTGYAEKKTINLSDGSSVILAAGSKLSYKSNWLDQPVKRVDLVGEAYFSITPKESKNKPKFIVETKDGIAAVSGTRFTVNTYGQGTKVVLEEGEVQVKIANPETPSTPEMTMQPGEIAQFSKSGDQIALDEVNPAVYTSWTTNELYFDETPFSVLVNRIERTYGKEVKIRDPGILDMKLSGSIDFRSLDGLINAVSEVMGVNIYKSAETVIIEQNN
ncbi:MAG: FecR domain-containing protein [Balneolaceae bacterium]|nr:FecR domain-containing protein [Balneolaceae bacterium]